MSEILQLMAAMLLKAMADQKSKGQILVMGSHFIWKKSVSGSMLSGP